MVVCYKYSLIKQIPVINASENKYNVDKNISKSISVWKFRYMYKYAKIIILVKTRGVHKQIAFENVVFMVVLLFEKVYIGML